MWQRTVFFGTESCYPVRVVDGASPTGRPICIWQHRVPYAYGRGGICGACTNVGINRISKWTGIYTGLRWGGSFSQMGRLTPDSTIADIITIMSGGAAGTTVLMHRILQQPDAMEIILQLDRNEIYGSDLWIVYKYMCNSDIADMFQLVRSTYIGKTQQLVKEMIAEIATTGTADVAKVRAC